MVQEVLMPKLGQTMEEGTIERWLKKEGDTVQKGEIIFEVVTDKATLEVEAFVSGTLLKILLKDGETAPVNEVIAFVGEKGEAIPEVTPKKTAPAEKKPEAAAKGAPAAAAVAEKAPPKAAPRPAVLKPEEIKASPRARKLAEAEKVPLAILRGSGPEGRIIEEDVEHYIGSIRNLKIAPVAKEIAYQQNVDLRHVQGSGPDGRITKEDVKTAASAAAAPALAAGREELSPMRRIVGQRMTESKTTIPHFYLSVEVDMTNAIAFRKALNEKNKSKIAYNDIIMKACAEGFREMPRMNASFQGDHVEFRAQADISLAVALDGGGLMVPVVRNVQDKDYLQIWKDSQELIQKARSKRLGPDDYEGGSLTISNLGMMDIDSFIPIINPGQACILGVGKIQEKVVVRDGGMYVRPMMSITCACDHRVVDGAEGAKYLAAVKKFIETVAM